MSGVSSDRQTGFGATRWSTATRATRDADASSARALGELCAGYWYPVYAYLRSSGHAPAIARDITRRFLGDILHGFRSDENAATGGHFRRFLLERLDAFLVRDWHDTRDEVDAEPVLPDADNEVRFQRDHLPGATPQQMFGRAFALEVLSRALGRVSTEAQERGHAAMYATLAGFLVRDPTAAELEALARDLRQRPLAVSIALKRLRQRFREIADEELADLVTNADQLNDERNTLLSYLGRRTE